MWWVTDIQLKCQFWWGLHEHSYLVMCICLTHVIMVMTNRSWWCCWKCLGAGKCVFLLIVSWCRAMESTWRDQKRWEDQGDPHRTNGDDKKHKDSFKIEPHNCAVDQGWWGWQSLRSVQVGRLPMVYWVHLSFSFYWVHSLKFRWVVSIAPSRRFMTWYRRFRRSWVPETDTFFSPFLSGSIFSNYS
jgi:hypothetical protein